VELRDRSAGLGAREVGVERDGRGVASAIEGIHLVLHERDERRNHQREARQDEGRELVAERFPSAGGHEHERIIAVKDAPDDALLGTLEGVKTKIALQIIVYGSISIN